MDLPFFSIIIPVRNREKLLAACLKSIVELDYPKDRYEVIVVDGDSDDGSARVAREAGATLLRNPRRKISPGRNIGFDAASGEFIAFCDSDCIVHPAWLRNATAYFARHVVGGVGGPIWTPSQGVFAQSVDMFFQLSVLLANAAHSSDAGPVRQVRHIPTCNLIARRTALDVVFPIEWGSSYGSDLELTRRLRRAGYRLLLTPDVSVWHHKRTTPASFFRQLFHYGAGHMCVARNDVRMLNAAHVVSALALPLLVFALVMGFLSPIFLFGFSAAIALGCLGLFVWVWRRCKRWKVALCSIFTLFIGVLAWSAGFLKEAVAARHS